MRRRTNHNDEGYVMKNVVGGNAQLAEPESGSDGGVVLVKAKGSATITLDRPASGNAIDLPLARSLMKALQSCERDSDVRAVVIRGRGRLFCTGGDLVAIREQGDKAPEYVRELLSYLHEALTLIANLRAPVVAAVNGTAAGAGLALACACDLTVALDSAKFVMAYTKVGLTPDGSSTWFLPRIIGLKRALELALSNRAISAAEAREWGLINEVLDEREFDRHVAELVLRLSEGATNALGQAKRLIRTSHLESLGAQMEAEADALCAALAGEEARNGLDSFSRRRSDRL
jgi:2-(1,2-epoxy-1,2-dihydrophenyl)acetyl-CoA isomerase